MNRLVKVAKVITKIMVAGVLALAILSLFVYGYSYTGVHVTNTTHATDYTWENRQWRSTMIEGFSWLHVDENGYNNQIIPETIDVLVMGSSHMEGFNVGKNENAVELLRKELTEWSFYNIGISGHDIYRCVDNVAYALDCYQPSKYVIIETSTVDLDEESMKAVIDGTAQPIPSYDTGLMYHMQKLPAVKWVFKQVQDWKNADTTETEQTDFSQMEERTAIESENLLDEFLRKVSQASTAHECNAIIVYHPTLDLAFFENANTLDNFGLYKFKSACEENDIIFVDLTDDFIELYEEKHLLAHGFANTVVGQGHLNRNGHEVMAKHLASVLSDDIQKEGVRCDVE